MHLTFEEEKELIRLKEESQRSLIDYQKEQDMGLIRFRAKRKELLEEYKNKLIQNRDNMRLFADKQPFAKKKIVK